MDQENQPGLLLRELRIVLNPEAAYAFDQMVTLMKQEMPTIKVQPSQFISFLVIDFLIAHFHKDLPVFIAEFFDSDAYHEIARKKARGSDDYEEKMAKALAEAKLIKSKKRRKVLNTGKPAAKESRDLA